MKLTDLTIKHLVRGKRYSVWCDEVPCFGLRVNQRTMTFVLKHQNRYHVLGRYPIISLKQARDEAKRRLALKYFPQTTLPTGEAIQQYLAHQEKRIRRSSFLRFRMHLTRDFPKQRLESLSAQDLHTAIKDLAPPQANLAFSVFKAFLNFCLERQYIDKHPLQRAKLPHKLTTRERVLSDEEMTVILRATLDPSPFSGIVQFLAYSGQRRTQVGNLQRAWIDFKEGTITWPKEEMKANLAHTLPLTPHLRRLVHKQPLGQYVFGKFHSWSRAKEELDMRVNLPHWTLHDLRRTARTLLSRYRISADIAERILAHTPPKMTRVYDRYLHLPAMQDALLKLEAHYAALLAPEHKSVSA